jgi:flagellin-like protein
MRRLGKKGISPLVATVLLITFAIVLGAIVLNYGQSFVKEATAAPLEVGECPAGCIPESALIYPQETGSLATAAQAETKT